MRVRALVDVEVVVRCERRHPEVDLERLAHLLERLALEPGEDLLRRRPDVRGEDRLLARLVVVGLELVADELDDGLHLLPECREDELVAPHRVPAELPLVRDDALVDEPAAAIGRAQGGEHLACRPPERGGELRVGFRLLLHRPQRVDLVPVAVARGVLQPAEEPLVDPAVRLLHHRPQLERRAQLGEVEHPVDLPVAVVDVDRVLEQHRDLRERELGPAIEHPLEEREVAVHLRDEAVPPGVCELEAVDREDRVQVRAHSGGVARVLGHEARHRVAVLLCARHEARLRGDRRRVQVAVDVLRQPVGRERRAEAAEHVVAGEPPAADVLEHRAERVRAMEVVEDPEQVLLGLAGPVHRERLVTEERGEGLLLERHRSVSCAQAGLRSGFGRTMSRTVPVRSW